MPLTDEDIIVTYRVVLQREPDSEGLRHYRGRAAQGMSLAELIAELRDSEEVRTRASRLPSEPAEPVESVTAYPGDLISPADVLRTLSVQDLINTAEEYYRRIPDPTPLMSKPFTYWHEGPQMLQDLGLLLSGMHIGKTMTVLDFGAGTCWLSRILAQLNCQPISCDVSSSALEIGRQLFERAPLIGTAVYRPIFLPFDGRRIDLPDASVDRIVCFDAFHHVPNPDEVIREFGRVLKPGGLVGFSEPGRQHSRSAQSQYEMRNHNVLENDINLNDIFGWARTAGFTSLTIKALVDRDLSLDEYNTMFDRIASAGSALRDDLWQAAAHTMFNRSIFFLHKGPLALDSRRHVGLAHTITADTDAVTCLAGEEVRLSLTVTNIGPATWLHQNSEIFGVVRVAAHLFDGRGTLLDLDFYRQELSGPVTPGQTIRIMTHVRMPATGQYRLAFDLVAEGVTWFENVGSLARSVAVAVTKS